MAVSKSTDHTVGSSPAEKSKVKAPAAKVAGVGLLNDIASLVKKEVGKSIPAPRNKPAVAVKSDVVNGVKRDIQ
jgi:hypothetical protein